MARKPRIAYPGAIYHVMNRGDRREAIFHDDRDRELFVATLAEACAKADWQVQAYCLMENHFHLVMERIGGRRTTRRSMGRFGGAGAGARRRFGRSCWRRWRKGAGRRITARSCKESATEKAERLVRAGLAKLGWSEADLPTRRKGERAKVTLAMKLRAETTMTSQ